MAYRLFQSFQLNKQVFIIEFKVVELDGTGNALAQIKAKRYFEKYAGGDDTVYLIGVAFSKDERNIVEFDWERKQ